MKKGRARYQGVERRSRWARAWCPFEVYPKNFELNFWYCRLRACTALHPFFTLRMSYKFRLATAFDHPLDVGIKIERRDLPKSGETPELSYMADERIDEFAKALAASF